MKKSTLVTFVVFAALLVGAIMLTSRKPERGISRMAFASLNKDTIDRVVISGKNAIELKKSKQDGKWHLANGKVAETAGVTRLLDALPNVKSSDLIARDKARHAEFEVDQEKGSKVQVYSGSSMVASFTIGKSTGGGVAVLGEEGIFKVSGIAPFTFSKPATSWIERKLFEDNADAVTRVEVKLAGIKPYALVKGEGAWKVEDPSILPPGFRFDTEAARSMASALANLRVASFEDTDPGPAATGLTDTADTISFVVSSTPATPAAAGDKGDVSSAAAAPAKQGAPAAATPAASSAAAITRTIRLGSAKAEGTKDVFARVEGRDELLTLPEYTVKLFRKGPLDLRSLEMMSFERTEVRKLSIVNGKTNLTFDKKDDTWSLTSSTETKPAGFELDPAAVEKRISALRNAQGKGLAAGKSAADAGLTSPSAKVTLTFAKGDTAVLVFGKEFKEDGKDQSYAKGNADDAVYVVNNWLRNNLTGGLDTFKKQVELDGGGLSNIDPKALSNLPPDVRESLMKQIEQKKREQDMLKRLQLQTAPAASAAPTK